MTVFDRRTTAIEVAQTFDLRGRTMVVTGASSGLGVETTRALAHAGADVIMAVRDVSKGEAIAFDLAAGARGELRVRELDLRSLESVESFAADVDGPIDAFIANAGVSLTPESHLPNGLDVRFATNHLGHFLLALRLRNQLASTRGRIVAVSSAGHKNMPVRLDDLQWTVRDHVAGAAYAESKTANILFVLEASRRWSADGISSHAVLPGSSLTGLQRFHSDELKRQIGLILEDGSLDPAMKTVEQGAATTVWAAGSPELDGRTGLVLEDCAEARPVGPDTHAWSGFDPSVADMETARQLWEHSLDLLRGFSIDV